MDKSKITIPPLNNLFGNELENFYALGLKHKNNYMDLVQFTQNMLQFGVPGLDNVVNFSVEKLTKNVLEHATHYKEILAALSDGLEEDHLTIATCFMNLEILAAISKWVPDLNIPGLGCSSLFGLNNKNQLVHTRTLDYPMAGVFDKHECFMNYNFPGKHKVFSIGTIGCVFPITGINDQGMSMALHQKHTSYFNPKGFPLFYVGYKILTECHNLESVLELLKEYPTLTKWGINLGFSNNEAVSIDVEYDKVNYQKIKLKKNKLIYFNNEDVVKDLTPKTWAYYAFDNNCQMRHTALDRNLSQIMKEKKQKTKSFNDLDYLKIVSRPFNNKFEDSKDWYIDILVPSGTQVLTMNPCENQIYFVPGEAPKVLQDKVLKIYNIFNKKLNGKKVKMELQDTKEKKVNQKYVEGYKNIALAQTELTNKDLNKFFHHLQMAEVRLEGRPEGIVAKFFSLAAQYIHYKNENEYKYLLKEFYEIRDLLPVYLEDQCLLFIARLENILFEETKIIEEDFHTPYLKNIFNYESSLPTQILIILKNCIILRLDILDIFHLFSPLKKELR
jgi:predicted choloylglycine hydrolase